MQGTDLDLIKALEKECKQRQLDGNGFSALLGINYCDWSRTKNRRRPLSLNTLRQIRQRLPHLKKYVDAYMAQGNGDTIQKDEVEGK